MIFKYSGTIEIEITSTYIYIYNKPVLEKEITKSKYTRKQIYAAISHCGPNQLYFNGLDLNIARYIISTLIPIYDKGIYENRDKKTSIKEEYEKQESRRV